ncbi:MAG: NAD(P)H-binding protein [Myxococcota bacterium]|nr:NAD(P)H-binding protein [Myxococcota bacterium]
MGKEGTRPALVVFGGTGFVGTAVLAEALSRSEDLHVFAVSRTGVAPEWLSTEPVYQTSRLGFLSGDLLEPQTVRDALTAVRAETDIVACISCVGAITPWSQANMVRTCGDANINAYTISKEIGAAKFAVITRDRSNMDDWWYPFPYLLPGYYEGKRKIEEFVARDVENAGNAICLRAGFVVGTRRTLPGLPTSVKIAVPMDGFYQLVGRLCPTIGVAELAGAAVRFVLSERKAETVLVPNEAIPDYFDGARE